MRISVSSAKGQSSNLASGEVGLDLTALIYNRGYLCITLYSCDNIELYAIHHVCEVKCSIWRV